MSDGAATGKARVERKSDRTRQQILDAAAEVFAEHGYGATRLSDIADSIGMKAGSFYYYFPSKVALIDEVLRYSVDYAFTSARQAVSRLPSGATAGERVRVAIAAHAKSSLDTHSYAAANVRLIGQVPADVRHRHYAQHQQPYGEFWAQLLAEAVESGEIRADLDLAYVRMLIVGSLNWAVEWPRSMKSGARDVADTLSALVFDGLTPRSSPQRP